MLENLEEIRENAKKGRSFNKKLSLWFYRRIQFTVECKALEKELEATYVNPRKTPSRYPRCGFVGDRDVIACMNLFIRYLRCGVALNTPKPDENPSGMQGNKDEG
ncbi:MAG: IS200/IS605 family accessory protein TnpB-related protein [Desulfurococcus sp.]|uniref:IS200/IS605 family accessory protein TnpB-related protein n=1 Tax=Desulfurococcus sp. TaxID=51678 RepID=UPI003165FEF3